MSRVTQALSKTTHDNKIARLKKHLKRKSNKSDGKPWHKNDLCAQKALATLEKV
jgi:hypothetical protein